MNLDIKLLLHGWTAFGLVLRLADILVKMRAPLNERDEKTN